MVKKNTCVFISGRGSNLKNLIHHTRDNNFPIKIRLVICNNKDAFGVKYAKKYNIPIVFINTEFRSYENKILFNIRKYNISFICLAGYMKIMSKNLIKNFHGKKIINIHPSLLPSFKGLNTHERAIKMKVKYSGCTVHFVNEELDSGEIIDQDVVRISEKDDEQSLRKKILMKEHKLYIRVIKGMEKKNDKF